jgi:hypothetical protein
MAVTQPTAVVTASKGPAIATKRPAETLTAVGAAAVILARVFGVDNDDTLTALTVLIGLLPAAITWLVQLFASSMPARQVVAFADPLEGARETVTAALKDLLERAKAAGNLQQEVAILTQLVDALRPRPQQSSAQP